MTLPNRRQINPNKVNMKPPSNQSRLQKQGSSSKSRMFWLAGLIGSANLAFHGTLGSEPSTGFMILAGSGMLRLRPSFGTPEASSDKVGMVMRLRQRHGG
jgi:hypothetical protein